MLLRISCGVFASLTIHLLVGWAWTILAAVSVGYWQGKRGALAGALAVGLSYLSLVIYSLIAAPAQTMQMADIMGEIIGGMPAVAVFVVTLSTGVLIGGAGGGLGAAIRRAMIHG